MPQDRHGPLDRARALASSRSQLSDGQVTRVGPRVGLPIAPLEVSEPGELRLHLVPPTQEVVEHLRRLRLREVASRDGVVHRQVLDRELVGLLERQGHVDDPNGHAL